MKRILTAIVLAPLIVWLVLGGPHLAFLAVLTAVALLCFHEYSGLMKGFGIPKPGPLGYAAGLILLFAQGETELYIILLAMLLMAAGIAAPDLKTSLPGAAATLLGVLYVFGAWRLGGLLRLQNPHWLMFALAVSWAGDIAAYYIGKRFGKHKMAPAVSPGKSWEGAAASVIGSVVFAILYLGNFVPGMTPLHAAIFGIAANVAGQAGDLAESAIKRGAGVKDSGTMLPGHGGWLDRVDSSMFAIPMVYFLVLYFS